MMDFSRLNGKRICVAVSGGVDSVSLLHYLKSKEPFYGYSLSAVHCEHGIRGSESVADAEFVRLLCEKQGVPCFFFSKDCPAFAKEKKMSLETAAREFRYSVFESLLQEDKADFIALAHHKNDEAETVLFRLARGTSLTGVGGMSEMNGKYIRPFLGWSRQEIEAYAKENSLTHREDKTNGERDATRNKLRLDVLPALEEAVCGAGENLVRFASFAIEDDCLLYELAKELVSVYQGEDGEKRVFVKASDKKPLLRRACLLALKALGVEKDYTATHLENASSLLSLHRGARQTMPKGVEAQRVEAGIEFYLKTENEKAEKGEVKPFDKNGFDGGRYEVIVTQAPIETENSWRCLALDGDKIPKTAVFRFRKDGDEIRRFGGGTKTLKKFFNEKKISPKEREYLPLIAEENGSQVYAVCGVEIADEVKITAETQNALYISIRKK